MTAAWLWAWFVAGEGPAAAVDYDVVAVLLDGDDADPAMALLLIEE